MFHLVNCDWDDDDSRLISSLERKQQAARRADACEDDIEETAPFLHMMPEESDHEHGSPVSYPKENDRDIDKQIQAAYRAAWLGDTPTLVGVHETFVENGRVRFYRGKRKL